MHPSERFRNPPGVGDREAARFTRVERSSRPLLGGREQSQDAALAVQDLQEPAHATGNLAGHYLPLASPVFPSLTQGSLNHTLCRIRSGAIGMEVPVRSKFNPT